MRPQRSPRTVAVHGPSPRPRIDGPVAAPLVQSSTFEFESMSSMKRYNETGEGHLYTRYGNPTTDRVEGVLAALEGAERALLFSSGMGATSAVYLSLLKTGDSIAAMRSIYGGTYRLISRRLPDLGIRPVFLETQDLTRFEERIAEGTRLLHLETPTNPILEIVDVADLVRRAHALGILVVVDSTFATPLLLNPLALGADLVIHSATKYLSGHSDVTGGVVAGSGALMAKIEEARRVHGATPDPFAAWLLHRGLKTLPIRLETQVRGAGIVAARLAANPELVRVIYPGLPDHPGHALASRQMRGFGAIVTIDVRRGQPAAERVMDRLELVLRAASLGSVESLASMPIHTSHTGYTDQELARAGVSSGMIRISIGIEEPDEIAADLEQALG